MINRIRLTAGAMVMFLLGSLASSAEATVIGQTLNADFSSQPYTLNLGSPARARYTFTSKQQNGSTLDLIATAGSARVASAGQSSPLPQPAEFYTDSRAPFIDDNLAAVFDPYASPTVIPGSATEGYLGLRFRLNDGVHFGYADLTGGTLLGFGYQSDPNTGIQAGAAIEQAPPASVPEPSSLAVLMLGVGLVGVGFARRRGGESV